jgi:hypothetical protein
MVEAITEKKKFKIGDEHFFLFKVKSQGQQ